MAKPTIDIEVWASQDYTLPNAMTKNKIRPIDDLWLKGYDLGQKPDAEAWNYVWFMVTDWLKYLAEEGIPDLDDKFMQKSANLSDVSNLSVARSNLQVYSKTETDERYLRLIGGTLSGGLKIGGRANTVNTTPGLSILWEESNGSGVTTLVNNPGTGTGGFVFRSVTPAGNVERGRISISPTGDLATSGGILSTGTITSTGDISAQTNLSVASRTTTGGLSVENDAATVNGKNIVRSINGISANAAGNIVLSSASMAASGWFKDEATGYIHQWTIGRSRGYEDEAFETVNFPIAFPTACLSVNTGTKLASESIKADMFAQVATWNRTSARVTCQWAGGVSEWDVAAQVIVWAVGN